MNLDEYYKKLPQRLQNSDKFLYYSIEFSKIIRKFSKSTDETNSYLNFLFKSTNIKADGFLRDVQILSTEMLRFIDNVCRKYDLEYILAYGTLLGAVRHKGFIPWDDDLDILMMRDDYNKLIEVLPAEINKIDYIKENSGLTLLKNFNENLFDDMAHIYTPRYEEYFFSHDPDYKYRFLQFACLKPFVKLDVFPFDYIKDDFVKEYDKKYLSQKYYFMRSYQNPDFSFEKDFNTISNKLGISTDETDYIGEGIDGSKWGDGKSFKKEIIFPTREINFENFSFKSPNKPHELLKIWYGKNYMNLPPNIGMHDYMGYNLLLFDNDEEEISIAFKNAIKEFKAINDNFEL